MRVKIDVFMHVPDGTTGGGAIYYDDISLQMKVPQFGENVLTNSGFEIAGSDAASADGWQCNKAGVLQRTNVTAHSGSWSAKLTGVDGDEWDSLYQQKYVGFDFGGKPYQLTAYIKSVSDYPLTSWEQVWVRLNYVDSNNNDMTSACRLEPIFSSGDAVNIWKPFIMTGVAPAGAVSVRVEIIFRQIDSIAGPSVYVDDLSFVTKKSQGYGDFDKDSDVDFKDLAVFVANWLKGE
jgi:hypothetical protein